VNFTTNYEEFTKDLQNDGEVVNDEEVFGGGDITWTMKLRERYREVMSQYSR
jgi:hypothetical protein